MGAIRTAKLGYSASVAAVALAIASAIATLASAATATSMEEAERRCGHAVLAARTHVQTTDTRTLARCALAVLSSRATGETGGVCRRLRTTLAGTDLVDRRARKRIAGSCARAHPSWLAASCARRSAPWPLPSRATPDQLAQCVVTASHCLARRAVESLVGALEDSVGVENPENLLFEYGDVDGNSFAACRGRWPRRAVAR